MSAIRDLSAASPAEIDTELERLMNVESRAMSEAIVAAKSIYNVAGMRSANDKPRFREDRPIGTLAEAIAKVKADDGYSADYGRKQIEALAAARAAIAAAKAEQEVLDDEFNARGGWSRAFIVLNTNGHVHSSRDCSTCFYARYDEVTGDFKPGTSYGWLPSLSGHDESEIVEKAGSDACTVCYPSAPVDTAGARSVFHGTEQDAQNARAERQAAKEAKAAAKAAKALLAPVPGPHGRIETIAAAKSFLTDAYAWLTHPYYVPFAEKVTPVAEALSAKTGEPVEALLAAAEKRAAKRK